MCPVAPQQLHGILIGAPLGYAASNRRVTEMLNHPPPNFTVIPRDLMSMPEYRSFLEPPGALFPKGYPPPEGEVDDVADEADGGAPLVAEGAEAAPLVPTDADALERAKRLRGAQRPLQPS